MAPAQTTTTFVPVNNGLFDDAALTGFTSFAMRVTSIDDWTSSGLDFQLTVGSLNHIAPGVFSSVEPPNGLGDSAGMPPLISLGDLTSGFNGGVAYEPNHVETATQLTTEWASTGSGDIGTFDVGIITLSDDAHGTLAYRSTVPSSSDWDNGGYEGVGEPLLIRNGNIIPEPGAFALVLVALIVRPRLRT